MIRDLGSFSALALFLLPLLHREVARERGKAPLLPPRSSHHELSPRFGELGHLQLDAARSLWHGPSAEKHGPSYTAVSVLSYLLSMHTAVIKACSFHQEEICR